MAGITEAAPSAATTHWRPAKRLRARASASAVPRTSDKTVDSAAGATENPRTRVRYGPTEKRSVAPPVAENRAPKPPATRPPIAMATKPPTGTRFKGALRLLGRRVQPLVRERAAVLL